MTSAGELRERVEIQREQQQRDSVGGFVSTWVTFARVWARVAPMTVNESFQRQQMQAAASWKITVRYWSEIAASPKQRVVWRGRTFEVRGVTNRDERRQFLELACEELSAQ